MRTSKVNYNTNGQKQCTKCQVFKDTSDFHKWSKGQDGLKLHCKLCVRNYDLKEDDPKRKFPRKVNEQGQIHCRNCGGYFDEENMKQSKNDNYRGLTYCIDCSPLLSRIRQLSKYGLTVEQYHQMLEDQDYKCKICKREDTSFRKRLSVDHDHSCCPGESSCGKCVRGLLCHHCNAGLGNFKDNPELMQKAIKYLQK